MGQRVITKAAEHAAGREIGVWIVSMECLLAWNVSLQAITVRPLDVPAIEGFQQEQTFGRKAVEIVSLAQHLVTLSPCGRGWFRAAARNRVRGCFCGEETPHPARI